MQLLLEYIFIEHTGYFEEYIEVMGTFICVEQLDPK